MNKTETKTEKVRMNKPSWIKEFEEHISKMTPDEKVKWGVRYKDYVMEDCVCIVQGEFYGSYNFSEETKSRIYLDIQEKILQRQLNMMN